MYSINKSLRGLAIGISLATSVLVPTSSGAEQGIVRPQLGLSQVALSLEKALPELVSAKDYRSASNTAFLLATARSRLDETEAACLALSQSLEYYRKAISEETGLRYRNSSGIDETSDGMAVIRVKFGCDRSRAA